MLSRPAGSRPTRPARVSEFRIRQVPRHTLHEKGSQRHKGVDTLLSSQEQKALPVPLINQMSAGCQPVILFPHSVYMGIFFCASEKIHNSCLRCPERHEGRLCPVRKNMSASHPPSPPCPAAPLCAALPNPPAVCPGFGFDRLSPLVVMRSNIFQKTRTICVARMYLSVRLHESKARHRILNLTIDVSNWGLAIG